MKEKMFCTMGIGLQGACWVEQCRYPTGWFIWEQQLIPSRRGKGTGRMRALKGR